MKKAAKKLLSSSLHLAKSTQWFVGSLLLMLTVASCVREHSDSPNKVSNGELSVTLNMDIPYASSAQTRAIGPTEENTIESIYVLAFEVNANGDEVFEYHSIAKIEAGHAHGVPNQVFTAKVRLKSYEQRFVIIANAKDQVETLLSNNWSGGLKDNMLKTLTVSLDNAGDKWNTINVGNYTKFPMWGERDQTIITENTTTLGSISMIRMIAKIDVRLNPAIQNANLFNEFKLASVHLYNTSQTGRVAPSTATGDWDLTNPSEPFALNPSMPIGWIDADRIEGPLAYTDFNIPGIPDQSMVGAIYTFEMPTDVTASKRPCLVVGGYYYDPVTSAFDTNQSYYRLDLIRKSDGSFMPVLRNHKYDFNIVNIKGRGYPTVDEAFHALPINMEVEIIEWNESGMNNGISEGHYLLRISKDEFTFPKDAVSLEELDNVLDIYTNYSTASTAPGAVSGWYISKIVDASGGAPITWLTAKDATTGLTTGPADVRSKLILTFDENTDLVNGREAIIWFAAGTLRYPVSVKQTTDPRLTIKLDKEALAFTKEPSTHKVINVTTYPVGEKVYFSSIGNIDWAAETSAGTGLNVTALNFKPVNNILNKDLTSEVTVYVMKDGKVASAKLVVTQTNVNTPFLIKYPYAEPNQNLYPEIGDIYKFWIYSPIADWTLTETSNPNGPNGRMITSMPTSSVAFDGDKEFSFGMNANPTWGIREAVYSVASIDPEFPGGQAVTIKQKPAKAKIVLTNPTVNLGVSHKVFNVNFTTNADWKFEGTGSGIPYPNIIGSSDFAVNTTHTGSANPSDTYAGTVKFTPVAMTPVVDVTPSAYELEHTYIKFATVSPVDEASQTLEIQRRVPSFYNFYHLSHPSIAGGGQWLGVWSTSNCNWQSRVVTIINNNEVVVVNPVQSLNGTGVYHLAENFVELNVPANPVTTPRDLIIQTRYVKFEDDGKWDFTLWADSYTIVQAGVASLSLNAPTVNLGMGTSAFNVDFKTNANWMFKDYPGTPYDETISSSTPSKDTEQVVSSSGGMVAQVITLYPKAIVPVLGTTPAASTEIYTYVNFQNVPANGDHLLTIKRIVPSFCSFRLLVPENGVVAAGGQTIGLWMNTNCNWQARLIDGSSNVIVAPVASDPALKEYHASPLEIRVPPNPTYVPRDVYAQTKYYNYQDNGTWHLPEMWTMTAGMTQAAATITATLISNHKVSDIILASRYGFNFEVSTTGTAPNFTIRYITSTHVTRTMNIQQSYYVDANTSTTTRYIGVYLVRPGLEDILLGTMLQDHGAN